MNEINKTNKLDKEGTGLLHFFCMNCGDNINCDQVREKYQTCYDNRLSREDFADKGFESAENVKKEKCAECRSIHAKSTNTAKRDECLLLQERTDS